MTFSLRKEDGEISIIRSHCKNCGHHKAWSKPRGVFCCRCRHRIEKND